MKGSTQLFKINLRRLLLKSEVREILVPLLRAVQCQGCTIWDAEGEIPLGTQTQEEAESYPIELSGEVLGWVRGGEGAKSLGKLLTYLAKKEQEKKQLAHEALDKYREITLLYNISQKLTACLDIKEVAKVVLDEAQRLMKSSRGAIRLLNPSTGELETLAQFGQGGEEPVNLKVGEGIVGQVIASGMGEIVNEVSSDPRKAADEIPVKSLMAVPLKTNDRAIGAISVSTVEAHSYAAGDLKLLTMLASQAASALENALLHESKLEESRREALLFRLATQIRYSLDLDTILETAVSEIRSLLDIDRCFFMWYRPHAALPAWEVVKEARTERCASLLGYYCADEIGSFGEQLIGRETVRVDQVENIRDFQMREFCGQGGLNSIVALPIQTRSGEIGAIAAGSCGITRPWSDREVELLEAVANQLAIGIEHAEMYETSQTVAQEAQAQAEQLQRTLEELQYTQTQLIQSEKMSGLGQMVAGIAHEVNNPVNFIHGNLEYAHQYSDALVSLIDLYQQHYPEPNPAILERMEEIELDFIRSDFPSLLSSMLLGTERIHEIVQSLRNFSRLDEAQMKPVDIHEGIDSTLLILQHRLKSSSGAFPIEIVKEYNELPQIECYASSLNQVFMNILSNAIDAVEEGPDKVGKIEIRTELITGDWKRAIARSSLGTPNREQVRDLSGGDRYSALKSCGCITPQPSEVCAAIPGTIPRTSFVMIRIRDNGYGIPEPLQKQLFDPFFTTKPVGKGTGLGLSISYQIVVEKHGGQLLCFSQPGEGTEFAIIIPLKQPLEVQTEEVLNCLPSWVLSS
ncbi:GAF domain-containing sensor histidine kinase [Laspinema olomoucense]|uniref:GAF domain-containing sensor histidine kinase n=1 Tax=Laspinema olomoucense TaxID=3231600 RepID=UPI00338D8EB6